jgi:hypothetical protein
MTDYRTLSDSELTEALNFHRRQRNLSNGINEAAHMRQTQVVRLLEAEQDRRLNEETPNHYIVSKRRSGEYGVAQDLGNNVWDHSSHHGTHKTLDAAKAWAAKHAGKYPHKIEVREEVEQIDELSKKTLGSYIKKAGGTSLDSAGAHMADYGANKNPKSFKKGINRAKGVMQAADRLTKEEVELDEASKPNQYIEVINKFTGAKSHHEVHPSKAFAALNHHNRLWNTKSARIVSGKEAEEIRASKMKKEEVEQIDELSKKTLGSYVKKAGTDQYLKGQSVQYHTNKANTAQGADIGFTKAIRKKHMNAADDALRKASNRDTGIGRAVDRLTKEEVELDEDTMPGNVALRLVDRHQAAAFHHKKNGNMKGYAAHFKVANAIEDSVIRAGRDMPIKSKRLEAASDKAFKEHPHRVVKSESVELDEVSASTLRSYLDKSRADKKAAMKDRTAAEKNVKQYGMASDKKERDDAARRVGNRNQGISVANKKLGTYPADKAKAKVMAREEVELDEASYRDIGYRNMLKADQKAEKELSKLRAQQAKAQAKKDAKALSAKPSKPEEFKEESNLRITKVYNKWPKPATYAVHNADRSYHKEFDSMEAAQAHKAEKSK